MSIDGTGRTPHQELLRNAIGDLGESEDGGASLWEGLWRELAPMIGERGFEALFGRGLHGAASNFPWLETRPDGGFHSSLSALRAELALRDAAEAARAQEFLLAHFVDTLAILIGDILTSSLLRKAWGGFVANHAQPERRNE